MACRIFNLVPRKNFNGILIEILSSSFEKMQLKMSLKMAAFCQGGNELINRHPQLVRVKKIMICIAIVVLVLDVKSCYILLCYIGTHLYRVQPRKHTV